MPMNVTCSKLIGFGFWKSPRRKLFAVRTKGKHKAICISDDEEDEYIRKIIFIIPLLNYDYAILFQQHQKGLECPRMTS